MEKKIMLIIFINIATFIPLIWICHLSNETRTFYGSLGENYINDKKLNTKDYRLLAKCKHNKDSCTMGLKEGILNNDMTERKDISNNENIFAQLNRQSNRSLSRNIKRHKKVKKNNSRIFETEQYSRFEKKIFKELDYANFLKNNRGISNKIYQKIIRKKYGFRLSLPIFFVLLLSILLLLDLFVGYGLINGLFKVLNIISVSLEYQAVGNAKSLQVMLKPLYDWLKESHFSSFFKCAVNVTGGSSGSSNIDKHYYITGFFGFLIYFIPIFIIGVTCLLGVFYYHKKVKKYEKIKFKKR
ncbi:fam-l protein [Plasmodium brasilianum]|uniref:Fam-l protein n=2 Tax=Plasmodium (Plasmodium) TaxID=418103 RepID=A0A1D3TDK0_PLAMA|nr:fam-l protein [Plasmodium malariae]KAI4836000.1 fam-l protein [Plasmodium brasilianum]SCP02970.1 fam-l protein [Plasmodium malariae]